MSGWIAFGLLAAVVAGAGIWLVIYLIQNPIIR